MTTTANKQPARMYRVYGLPPALRPEAAGEAARLRQASMDAAEFVKSLGLIAADDISPVTFAEFRSTVASVLGEAQSCLDNVATMLSALAELDVVVPVAITEHGECIELSKLDTEPTAQLPGNTVPAE